MSGNQRPCRMPSEKQRTILRILAEAERPLRSAELQRRARLLTGEFRGALYWLRDNGYIVCVVKKIKTFGIGLAKNKKAFWSLLPKGRQALEPLPDCRNVLPLEDRERAAREPSVERQEVGAPQLLESGCAHFALDE